MLTHDGLNERSRPLEQLERLVSIWLVLEVSKGLHKDVGHQWV